MTYTKEREQFIQVLLEELPGAERRAEVEGLARELMRRASISQRIAELQCSVEMTERAAARIEREDEANDAAIQRLCRRFGLGCVLQGDPRGYTVAVLLPSGRYNTWGGAERGWGVPARAPVINYNQKLWR